MDRRDLPGGGPLHPAHLGQHRARGLRLHGVQPPQREEPRHPVLRVQLRTCRQLQRAARVPGGARLQLLPPGDILHCPGTVCQVTSSPIFVASSYFQIRGGLETKPTATTAGPVTVEATTEDDLFTLPPHIPPVVSTETVSTQPPTTETPGIDYDEHILFAYFQWLWNFYPFYRAGNV